MNLRKALLIMYKFHELKILREYFNDIVLNNKRFEIRRNKDVFEVGDWLLLNEWHEKLGYSERQILAEITYKSDYKQKDDYCVLGIKVLKIVD